MISHPDGHTTSKGYIKVGAMHACVLLEDAFDDAVAEVAIGRLLVGQRHRGAPGVFRQQLPATFEARPRRR
jgi:hypothetical protein